MLGLLAVWSDAIAHPIDVTAKVREAVKDNALSIAASSETFGNPQTGDAKELVVEFRLANEVDRKVVGEGGVLEIKGSADKPLAIIKATYKLQGSQDFELREYVYTSKDLPHSEANPWKLVCQLPYNARFTGSLI